MAKDFRTLLEEAGDELALYQKRLQLAMKPAAEWDNDDIQLALVCNFQWCQWMQAVLTAQGGAK